MQIHCVKKFEDKSIKLGAQIDKADAYLGKTIDAFKKYTKESKQANICMEANSVRAMKGNMKKFDEMIEKVESQATYVENDYQFVFNRP